MASVRTPVVAAGSSTDPGGVSITLPTQITERWFDALPVQTATWNDGWAGVFLFNGHDPVRHVVEGDGMQTGILPPSTAMTATPSGTRATAILDCDVVGPVYTIANGDTLFLVAYEVHFLTSVGASESVGSPKAGSAYVLEVKVGSTNNETFTRLQDIFAGTAVQGTDYQKHVSQPQPETWGIEVSAINASDDCTFRAVDFSSAGNTYWAQLETGGGWSSNTSLGGTTTTAGATTSISNYFSGGADGSGSTPYAGSYQYAQRYIRNVDGALSGIGEIVTATSGANQEIDLASLTASGDPDVDGSEWLRTTAGGYAFLPGDTIVSGTTDTDGILDSDLSDDAAVKYDASIFRPFVSGHIPRFRAGVVWKGRLWGGGAILAASKTLDQVTMTNGSKTISFAQGVPTEDWVGRYIRRLSGSSLVDRYLIVSVDKSAKTAQISRDFDGTTGAAGAGIEDLRNPSALYFSEPGLPNQFPPQNEITGVKGPDSEGITGMAAVGDRLFIWTRASMWVLVGDSIENFVLTQLSGSVGCVAPKSIVEVEGGVMWLAPDGIYSSSGGAPQKMSSSSNSGDRPSGIDGTINRINARHAHLAYGRYCQMQRIVQIYVPLDSDVVPRHAITYDLGVGGAFSLDERKPLTTASNIFTASGSSTCVAGDEFGYLWELGKGSSDGAFGFTPVFTITGTPTVNTLSAAAGSFSGLTLDGFPCLIVAADGTVTTAEIKSNGTADLVLARDLDAAPSADDQVVIGGIHMDLKTGKFDLGETRLWKIITHLILTHSPETDGEIFIAFSGNQDDPAIPTKGYVVADLSNEEGRTRFAVQRRAVMHQLQFQSIVPGCTPTILGYEMGIRARDGMDL